MKWLGKENGELTDLPIYSIFHVHENLWEYLIASNVHGTVKQTAIHKPETGMGKRLNEGSVMDIQQWIPICRHRGCLTFEVTKISSHVEKERLITNEEL